MLAAVAAAAVVAVVTAAVRTHLRQRSAKRRAMCVGSRDVLHQGFVRAKIEQPKRAWRPRLGGIVLINLRTWRIIVIYFGFERRLGMNQAPVTTISRPVKRQGGLLGICVFTFDFEELKDRRQQPPSPLAC